MTRAWVVSGGGNDFLALVEPARDPSAAEISAWCARGLSIGADGVFVLRRRGLHGAAMSYWNADGQPAPLCLNGARCAARLALRLGWGRDRIVVETGAGDFPARAVGTAAIALDLPTPIGAPEPRAVDHQARRFEGWYLTVGVPHFVLLWDDSLAECPVEALGAPLRRHPSFEQGTNVNFVRFPRRDRLEIRTYERGVDAETLACGTGVLAATAVGLHLDLAALPLSALTLGGFALEVGRSATGDATDCWSLAGDARVLARIDLNAEAARPLPPPPVWSP